MKIHPVGAKLHHADGHTDRRSDMTKFIVAFHNFANAHKKRELTWSPHFQSTPLTTRVPIFIILASSGPVSITAGGELLCTVSSYIANTSLVLSSTHDENSGPAK